MSIPDDKKAIFDRATIWSTNVHEYIPVEEDDFFAPRPLKWLDALENIQSCRDAIVTPGEIDEAILFRTEYLPAEIHNLITVMSASCGYEGMWDDQAKPPKHDKHEGARFRSDAKESYHSDWLGRNGSILKDLVVQTPYLIWPLNTGNGDWQVIFMVLEKIFDKETLEEPTEYRRLAYYAIIDPRLSGVKPPDITSNEYYGPLSERADYISRLFSDLLIAFNIDRSIRESVNKDAYERTIWVPKQREEDTWSGGLRIIQFAWEMIERILDMETSGIRNYEALFRPMRPYFNPDYVRLDAAGAIAARGLDRQNFRARIVLARVNEIKSKTRPQNPDPAVYSRTFASDLYAALALPKIDKVPEKFRDVANISEVAYNVWKLTTHKELNRGKLPGFIRELAKQYNVTLPKEPDDQSDQGSGNQSENQSEGQTSTA